MRPCQVIHYRAKIEEYKKMIDKAQITLEDQKKRIACFKSLIEQIEQTILDAVRKDDPPDVD